MREASDEQWHLVYAWKPVRINAGFYETKGMRVWGEWVGRCIQRIPGCTWEATLYALPEAVSLKVPDSSPPAPSEPAIDNPPASIPPSMQAKLRDQTDDLLKRAWRRGFRRGAALALVAFIAVDFTVSMLRARGVL